MRGLRHIQLDGPVDIDGFRHAARRLLAEGIAPDEVSWSLVGEAESLWDAPDVDGCEDAHDATTAPPFSVPASFARLCQDVLLHREPQRFALMYRLLFRLKMTPGFWRDPLDAERRRAERLAREVRHEIHKMHAFVRFVPVPDGDDLVDGPGDRGGNAVLERLVAWFEPEHHVLEAAAPFFARRFANLRWAILTPRCSVSWDGKQLDVGPGGRREDAPAQDAGADLWLTYYRSIFNPARLKVAMMEREMPRRYWANLPEAALIEPLIAQAAGRTRQMIDAGPTEPRRIKEIELPPR